MRARNIYSAQKGRNKMARWGSGRRIGKDEAGQVLYMTLVMMMCLCLFTLVLVNFIIFSLNKIRAQDAADAVALSVAAKKADVLNRITEVNMFLDFVVRVNNTKSNFIPYLPHEIWLYMQGYRGLPAVMNLVARHNQNIRVCIEEVAQQNGLRVETSRLGVYAETIDLFSSQPDIQSRPFIGWVQLAPPPKPPVPIPGPGFQKDFEPQPRARMVQTRVEWRMPSQWIGSTWLKGKVPDIVTQGRAMLVDRSPEGKPWSRDWDVRLVQPQDRADEFIQQHMR